MTISGTVGAAIEAGCSNIPALAISFETLPEYHLHHSNTVDFTVAAHFTRYFAQQVLAKGLPGNVDLLKIDIPASATPQTGWRMAHVSRQRYYQSKFNERTKTDNADHFSYHIHIDPHTLEPGSDIHVFAMEKLVSVVPMTIDLTAPIILSEATKFFNGAG